MYIQPITQTNFKCRTGGVEKIKDYGKVICETGIINKKKLDIYSAYDKEGNLIHKLYYLADETGRWLKSKLKFYKGRQVARIIRSENDKQQS